jgi:hypothetical protein
MKIREVMTQIQSVLSRATAHNERLERCAITMFWP